MDKIKKKPDDGDIFVIPLYLPSYQKWRETFDEFIDYRKYKLCGDDIYVYGRIIEPYDNKSVYLVELFRLKIPVMTSGEIRIMKTSRSCIFPTSGRAAKRYTLPPGSTMNCGNPATYRLRPSEAVWTSSVTYAGCWRNREWN